MRVINRIALGLIALGALTFGSLFLSAQAPPDPFFDAPFDLERIKRATVLVVQTRDVGGRPQIVCVNSGTLVSRDGLIVTNAHSSVPNPDCNGNRLMIGLSVRPDEPPILTYQADVIQFDAGLDLALLRITRGFDGRAISADDLFLPFVELADSDEVRLDDTITVVGYPGIRDEVVTSIRGSVQGFTAEPSGGQKSWIKIRPDATATESISGTISGGGAYNREGRLIGVPTSSPVSRQSVSATCVRVQDTNGDGLINLNDACVPIGGAINVLRPANFARVLLRGASLGLTVEKLSDPAVLTTPIGLEPRIGTPFFAPSLNGNMPSTVVNTSLPAGTDALYLFFEYRDMSPETVYEVRVTLNGNINPVFSLTPVRWSGGRNGLWYVGTTGQVMPNGDYDFTVFINGVAASEPRRISIGGAPPSEPTFSSITFGLTEGNQMFSSGPVLGTGTTVRAQFIYNNMRPDITWTAIWYYEGVELQRSTDTWGQDRGGNGSENIGITVDTGLPPGIYRLELYIENRLAAISNFTVAGARDANLPLPRVFDRERLRFAIGDTPQAAINARPITTFTNRLDSLYAIFDWEQLRTGTLWRMRWAVDGITFYDQTLPWSNAETGVNYVTRLSGANGIPDGTYTMELSINGVILGQIEMDVGIGQLPIDPFADAEGVQVSGVILDSVTGEGIPNVTFMVISELYSVADFVADYEQLYALATTDRNGRFVIDRPLRYGRPYSVLIRAYGYMPIGADGVIMRPETPNPLELTIYLVRH